MRISTGRKSLQCVVRESFKNQAKAEANGWVFTGTPVFENDGMTLDGSSYASLNGVVFQAGAKKRTIRMKVKRTTETGGALLEFVGPSGKKFAFLDVQIAALKYVYSDGIATSVTITDGERTPIDEWADVVLAFNGSKIFFYIDGVLIKSSTITTDLAATFSIFVGHRGVGQNWSGGIKDLLITESYWEQQEVTDDINKSTYNFLDKSSLYLALNSETGGVTPDFSSHGRHGVVTGATKLTGINGYSFDGVNDRITFATPGISGDAEFTLWAWVKPEDITTLAGVLTIGNVFAARTGAGLFVNLVGGGSLSIEFAGNNGWRTAAGAFAAGESFLFSVSKTAGAIGTTTKLYKNGAELSCSLTGSGTPNIDGITSGVVGAFSTTTNFFKGVVDSCGIEPIALSATQHRELFNRGGKYLGNR
jgi:hypothetical protein